MNATSRTALAAFALLLSAPHARAAIGSHSTLFDIEKRDVDKGALERIANVDAKCTVSMMSRIGPTPAQREQCDTAMFTALATPREAAVAALYYLDTTEKRAMSVWRIYDVVARSGQLDLAEKLVAALEKIEARQEKEPRSYERGAIAQTLSRLTFAEPKGTPAIAWREWLTAHKHETRPQLLAAHVARLRTVIANPETDGSVLMTTIEFLANEPLTRDEGLRQIANAETRKRMQPYHLDRLDRLAKTLTARDAATAKPTTTKPGASTASLEPRG